MFLQGNDNFSGVSGFDATIDYTYTCDFVDGILSDQQHKHTGGGSHSEPAFNISCEFSQPWNIQVTATYTATNGDLVESSPQTSFPYGFFIGGVS